MSAANSGTKSYLVLSVDKAIATARRELGPDAMLLYSRRLAGAGGQGRYEVVFSVKRDPAAPRDTTGAGAEQESTEEMQKLHAQIDEIRSMLASAAHKPVPAARIAPELAGLQARLAASEVDPALSKEIVDRVEAEMATDVLFQRHIGPAGSRKTAGGETSRLETFVSAEMQRRVRLDARLGDVVVLVGPNGSGKTTSLMKLAAAETEAGHPVRLLSLDSPRASGQLQLRTFANNLKIPFTAAGPQTVAGLINEARAKTGSRELILIDTPGFFEPGGKAAESIAEALAQCGEPDVHLVAPGYMKAGDLRLCIQRLRVFRPAKLLVTRLDETRLLGSIFSEAAHSGLSLSYLSHGPSLSDHLRRAALEDLLSLALDRRQTRAQVA